MALKVAPEDIAVCTLHLAWLNSKKLGFTLFLLYFHKG